MANICKVKWVWNQFIARRLTLSIGIPCLNRWGQAQTKPYKTNSWFCLKTGSQKKVNHNSPHENGHYCGYPDANHPPTERCGVSTSRVGFQRFFTGFRRCKRSQIWSRRHADGRFCCRLLQLVLSSSSAARCRTYKTTHVRTTFGGADVEKEHAVVARSTFRSQNVQNTARSDHFGRSEIDT